ncbi:hypothetical protein JCM10212_002711 [Sporobolomyces blumeae]
MLFSPSLVSFFILVASSVTARNAHTRRGSSGGAHSVDFGTFASSGQSVDDFLWKRGYMTSAYTIATDVFGSVARRFDKSNVKIEDGLLKLKVNGFTGGAVVSSEIESISNFKYGTMTAKATAVEGVCQGIFFYHSTQQEIDIELLSSYYTKGYKQIVLPGAQYTNQPAYEKAPKSAKARIMPFDPTTGFHNWTPDATRFYLDGVLQWRLTQNVPQVGSKIILNNWSNGDPNWSAGPPKKDAYLLVKSLSYTPL